MMITGAELQEELQAIAAIVKSFNLPPQGKSLDSLRASFSEMIKMMVGKDDLMMHALVGPLAWSSGCAHFVVNGGRILFIDPKQENKGATEEQESNEGQG